VCVEVYTNPKDGVLIAGTPVSCVGVAGRPTAQVGSELGPHGLLDRIVAAGCCRTQAFLCEQSRARLACRVVGEDECAVRAGLLDSACGGYCFGGAVEAASYASSRQISSLSAGSTGYVPVRRHVDHCVRRGGTGGTPVRTEAINALTMYYGDTITSTNGDHRRHEISDSLGALGGVPGSGHRMDSVDVASNHGIGQGQSR
jgi:hypothetical protein